MDEVKLGDKVKCKLTGIAGVVVAKAEYLHSPPRIAIPEPGSTKNEWVWLEVAQVGRA
ncbi:hypothetical protein [Sphingorhabdus sp. 109]|uniref:hypothetical protein n=1 Tax=Sphingorhabdus sp. 109 TaxID=2653173 RepID=UPI0012EF31FB|nr:hypothetical protein [Sphingorhabdus sp. 109]VWX56687.1 conserved hypothetical protein [Sphingorhabdus sp. 109]